MPEVPLAAQNTDDFDEGSKLLTDTYSNFTNNGRVQLKIQFEQDTL